jgi:TPR repeat protein
MRLPRVRFTVRRMMVAVAVVALVFACGLQARRLHRLSRAYAEKAARFGFGEKMLRAAAAMYQAGSESLKKDLATRPVEPALRELLARDAEDEERNAERILRSANYRGLLRSKYEHAAAHPWLPVADDPPYPE